MGLRIGTNVAAMTAMRHLGLSTQRVARSMERLSSGLRINRAADDPAGLAMSLKLRSKIRSLGQSIRGAQDGISLVQTAEGNLNEISNLLVRMRELAQQAATETIGETERGYLQSEFEQLREEIERIADTAGFGTLSLLNGSAGSISIQVGTGTDANSRVELDLS